MEDPDDTESRGAVACGLMLACGRGMLKSSAQAQEEAARTAEEAAEQAARGLENVQQLHVVAGRMELGKLAALQ